MAHFPIAVRILAAAAMVAPLGLYLRMPFPKGAQTVGPLGAWCMAVNGVASVLGGTTLLFLAMTFGFRTASLVAAGLYL